MSTGTSLRRQPVLMDFGSRQQDCACPGVSALLCAASLIHLSSPQPRHTSPAAGHCVSERPHEASHRKAHEPCTFVLPPSLLARAVFGQRLSLTSSHGTRNTPITPHLCTACAIRKKPRLCVKGTAQVAAPNHHPCAPQLAPHGETENSGTEEHTIQAVQAESRAPRTALTPPTPPATQRTTHHVLH